MRARTIPILWLALAGMPSVACRQASGAGLAGGAPSRDALVRGFVTALERRDTAALVDLVLTRAEFASVYYPTAREALPPYELPQDLMWFRLVGESDRGLRRALDELGGRPLRYRGHTCGEPRREGRNRLWGWCRVRLGEDEISIFGLIVERDGRFKFVSYANKL